MKYEPVPCCVGTVVYAHVTKNLSHVTTSIYGCNNSELLLLCGQLFNDCNPLASKVVLIVFFIVCLVCRSNLSEYTKGTILSILLNF